MTKSKEMLIDLVNWSEKNGINLEKWIMMIRLDVAGPSPHGQFKHHPVDQTEQRL